MRRLKLRPHHLICNLCFQGKGYNSKFIQNFSSINKKIENPNTIIEIVDCYDDICAKCPNKSNNLCHCENKVAKMDYQYLNLLRLKKHQVITTLSLKTKIKKFLTIKKFQNICGECSWYKLNICNPIIHKLIQKQ